MTAIAQSYLELSKKHWPADVPHELKVPDESLWAAFEQRALDLPDQVGIEFLGREYTWKQLYEQANALAGGLQSLGLQKGDRVLLFTQNCPQYVVAFHAVLFVGGVLVPVNPMNKAIELEHYIEDAEAKIAIASSDIASEMAQASAGLKLGLSHLVVFELADALLQTPQSHKHWPDLWKRWLLQRHPLPNLVSGEVHAWGELLAKNLKPHSVQTQGQDMALLPYTSGTTGASKGCIHTHTTLMHNAMAAALWQKMGAGDTQLIVVPMFHITGLVMGMLASIRNGCKMVLMPRWDRKVAAMAISGQRITHWPNIPTMVIDLLSGDDLDQYDLSSLRYVGGGGAPMPEAVGKRLKEVFGLDYIEGYGLTESSAPTHSNPMSAPRRHCLGIAYVSTRALIIDTTTLEPLPVGEVGEIVVNGPQLFKGYWRQEQATDNAHVLIDGVRYFRTGDIGRMDEEGYFFMSDRLKRMINASGFKVWPAEVEGLLHHHPAIKESCVISTRDPYRGESVKALVVLHTSSRGSVVPQDIVEWSKDHMAAYKYPREVEFVDELPRTATGKVLWRMAQTIQDEIDDQKSRDK